MKKLKTAIIGCGRISYKHLDGITDNFHEIELMAVCDPIAERAIQRREEYLEKWRQASASEEQASASAEQASISKEQASASEETEALPQIWVYEDYRRLFEGEKPDIAAIAAESGYHAQIAIDCMKRGIHVIVEKPMAMSIADGQEMIETAKRNNVKLCIAHQNRFNPAVEKLRGAVEAGRFGRMIAGNARVLWNRNENYYKQASWRGTYALDGGCLMNQCIHNIDLLQWMMNSDVSWVNGITHNYLHPYIEAEDYGSIQIGFQSGAIGNVEGTVCINGGNLEETLTIIGEKGTVSLGGIAVNQIETWRFEDHLDTEEEVKATCNQRVENVYGSGHTALYRDLIKAIRMNQKPYISGEDGVRALTVILAAYQSNRIGQRVAYPVKNLSSADFGQ